GMDTNSLLMILNGYSGMPGLMEAGKYSIGLLRRYASAINIDVRLVDSSSSKKIEL
ncbi:hypothetical protein EVA_09794, partial [gut metagenome]